MRPITLSHVEFCRQSCEKEKGDVDDSNDSASVESIKMHIADTSNISSFNINVKTSLRSILSPLFSIFGISQNVLFHVQSAHICVMVIVLSLFLMLKSSYFGRHNTTMMPIPTSCNTDLAELTYQIKALAEEMKQLRLTSKN